MSRNSEAFAFYVSSLLIVDHEEMWTSKWLIGSPVEKYVNSDKAKIVFKTKKCFF